MSRVCHECGKEVEWRYYDVSACYKDADGRIAETNMSCSICEGDFWKSRHRMGIRPTDGLCFVLRRQVGAIGGLHGSVQLSSPSTPEGEPFYLSSHKAQVHLPKVYKDLLAEPEWLEQVGEGYEETTWMKGVKVS